MEGKNQDRGKMRKKGGKPPITREKIFPDDVSPGLAYFAGLPATRPVPSVGPSGFGPFFLEYGILHVTT